MKDIIKTTICSVAAAVLLSGPTLAPAFAEGTSKGKAAPAQKSAADSEISDKDLLSFIKAEGEITRINATYKAELQKADGPAEAQKVQREAQEKMSKAVEGQGLSVASFNNIIETIQTDEGLRDRYLKLMKK